MPEYNFDFNDSGNTSNFNTDNYGWMSDSSSTYGGYTSSTTDMFNNFNFDSAGSSQDTGFDIWAWLGNLTDNQSGMGAVGGLATAGINAYQSPANRDQQQKQYDQSQAYDAAHQQQQMELAYAQMVMQAELERERLAIMQATLDDKINTRKRLNESINAGPSRAPQQIRSVT